ncbi:sigma-70 family RNA polymerase sigma factor [Alcaligenes ammonioxydans]|jgi:RNA polymerase sigma factor (sigma-70 family)|uniref:Sigma-70 family RNA polymerase sigma factor n=1 Tax=Alcaligenes ammonioxydans TaxID=2582914 RepID=A0ABX8SRQ7_9BURK|nr:sigma-70 family RNA polymerase sigma factor [Alcaligenes ammonioxydans]EJC62651.1 ECF subfamily RNA polymerase sigma-24 subunit [Alcaligenes faecalis subsp. faecalis NCIB 8687]QBH20295.1 sigma-70 family RNA polymerase sigma factor [Alcaligenes faecalis]MCH1879510.1 sigma-70 family RNA polymerase sigma factor [Alcaligenes ammonioxydans]QXX78334.1 sigma-70 family RNA polymerase sigma factor [Alcaligenes ammonioxydans]WGQ36480.1 sigma-70 family RNA polymerase sigma factor [Alcaligenes faecalis
MDARHYSELVNFFARFLNDREAAREVVQESYARVFAGVSPARPARNLRALLFRAGKNIVIDGARRRQAEQVMLDTLTMMTAREAPSTEYLVQVRQQLQALLSRLGVMPRKRREVFVLVRIYGFSHQEAASHLGLSLASIEKHVVRAVMDCLDLANA